MFVTHYALTLHFRRGSMNAYYNERTIMENPSAFPMGEPNDGFAQYFVGQSYLASVLDAPDFSIHNVTFEPGCRNNWLEPVDVQAYESLA